MKAKLSILGMVIMLCFGSVDAQYAISNGPAGGITALIPFTLPTCVHNGTSTVSVCGFNASFNFTNTQISSCPNTGQITAPGSVAYGGPGTSASFNNYHSLSYSPSNENQRLVFAQKIHTFQFSVAGPNGSAEPFGIQVYDAGALMGSYSFTAPGTGNNNTYTITGPQFDRIDFVETNAISADDELFGDFFIASAGCPFSIEYVNTSLEVLPDNQVNVFWETLNENNMSHFEVERSENGSNWTFLGRRDAVNAMGSNTYSFLDQDLPTGHYYYRISMIQADGVNSYGKVMEVELGGDALADFELFPNPAQNQINLDFKQVSVAREITILNATGSEIQRWKSSEIELELDLSNLSNGIYFMRVGVEGKFKTKSFEVSK